MKLILCQTPGVPAARTEQRGPFVEFLLRGALDVVRTTTPVVDLDRVLRVLLWLGQNAEVDLCYGVSMPETNLGRRRRAQTEARRQLLESFGQLSLQVRHHIVSGRVDDTLGLLLGLVRLNGIVNFEARVHKHTHTSSFS